MSELRPEPRPRLRVALPIAFALTLAAIACDEQPAATPPSLESPAALVYAPQCVVAGTWLAPSECPPDTLLPRAYVANEEAASIAVVEVTAAGATIVDTRESVPGATPVVIGGRPRAIAATEDGAFVVTVNTLSQDISVVAAGRALEIAAIATDEPGMDLLYDAVDRAFWFAFPSGRLEARTLHFDCGAGDGVYQDGCAMQPADFTFDVEHALELPGSVRSLQLDPTRRRLYAAYADLPYVSAVALGDSDELCTDDTQVAPCEVSRLPIGYGCSDGLDNDGDGFVDAADPQCYQRGGAESPEGVGRFVLGACSDLVDDDGDGLVDLLDPGCEGPQDGSEDDGMQPIVASACTDGLDNDGDGLTDNRDPDCTWENDDDEAGQALPAACADGFDNDNDGFVDFGADDGCASFADATEDATVACADGLDNDGDGTIDLADTGCLDHLDLDEAVALGPCENGIDDDGDGLVDTADAGCYGAAGATEREVERIGFGPMGIDPKGRWLYVVDASDWQVVVVDLATEQVLDAGSTDPESVGPGIQVNPLPRAVVGDVRETTMHDEGGVLVTREEAVFYAATTAGTVDMGSVHQTFTRTAGGVSDVVELDTLRLGDGDNNQSATAGARCVNLICDANALPDITLRQRATVSVTDAGALERVGTDGAPISVPADELMRTEPWVIVYEGVLPGAARTDGIIDEALPGRLSAGGNFCTMGVQPGDHLVITDSPAASPDVCGDMVDGLALEWRVAYVRATGLYLEPIEASGYAQTLPSRTCFPFGVAFEVRVPNTWIVEAEKTKGLHALPTQRGQCLARPSAFGGGRVLVGEPYQNAFFGLTLADVFPAERDVAVTFSLASGFAAVRLSSGPLPGDIEVIEARGKKFIYVTDAGSNQVFIYDAKKMAALDAL